MLCENFNDALEYQLSRSPDIDLESLKNYIERRKQIATNIFEIIWKPGNLQIQEERKSKLEKQLKLMEEEAFEKHQLLLESKSVDQGRKLLGEVKTILLERSRQLKSYVDKQQGQVPIAKLREIVEETWEYLMKSKGCALRESHEEIFNNLMKIMEDEIKFLTKEPKAKITAEDAVGYAEGLNDKLISCFTDKDNASDNTLEMQQESFGRDPNKEPRHCATMQDILNELKEEHWDGMDLEENGLDGSTPESNVVGSNDDNNVGAGFRELDQFTGRKKTRRCSSRRLKRSVKDLDSNSTKVSDIPPSKMQRTGHDVPRMVATRAVTLGDIHRRSSRLNKNMASDSNSKSAQTRSPTRDYPRSKKILHGLDITDTSRSDVEETSHSNCEDEDASSNPPVLRANKRNADNLNDSKHEAKSSKYSVSKTTRRPNDRNGRKSHQATARKPRSNSDDDKMCPKGITILKGGYRKYLCNVCKKTFNTEPSLKHHGEFCGTAKSFICNQCGNGFYTQVLLDVHARVHTGVKEHECPKCPQRFLEKRHLQKHIRCHAKEKKYICKPCNLTFVSPHSLHEHNLNHEGRLPYACRYCDERYDRMIKLRYHVIVHAHERPFECTECGVSFVFKDSLYSHHEHYHSQPKEMAQKLTYDASVAYLLKETKNESCRDIPATRIYAAVIDHVIKKAKLLLPHDNSASSSLSRPKKNS